MLGQFRELVVLVGMLVTSWMELRLWLLVLRQARLLGRRIEVLLFAG